MLIWINEHLNETKTAIREWRISRNVNMLATVDHVEMARSHVIMGLNVGWENQTDKPIKIIEIQVMIYKRKEDALLLRLLPLERFSRTDIKRILQKKPLSQITLAPHEIHTEHIRFLNHGSIDIPAGTYITDIQITDTEDNRYSRRTKILVESKMKYRPSDDWRPVTEAL